MYLRIDKYVNFKREIWFVLGKCMCRKHRSFYQDYLQYVRNDIVKPFRVRILCNAERIRDMNDLEKCIPAASMKGESYEAANWKVRNQGFTVSEIRVAIKDSLHTSMKYELDEHQ